jgi:C-terminal processing protease CtpA/Prc
MVQDLKFADSTLDDLVNSADEGAKAFLANAQSLRQFLGQIGKLTPEQRRLIVEQAIEVLEGYYVHLPFKRAMHAIDPLQRLRLLRKRLPQIQDERAFHQEMTQTFTCLRDLHTRYYLPRPYNGMAAFLPFAVERGFDGGQARYIVSKTSNGFFHASFGQGAELVDWNGIPIERARRDRGGEPSRQQLGGAAGARHPRPHGPQPRRDAAARRGVGDRRIPGRRGASELRFQWAISGLPEPVGGNAAHLSAEDAAVLAMDFELQAVHSARKILFAQHVLARQRDLETAAADANASLEDTVQGTSTMGDVFEANDVVTSHGTFGYLRIRTFLPAQGEAAFVREFERLIGLLSPNGLIIDVRDNGGGIVPAGERLLQMLTPNTIEPTRYQFINTPATAALSDALTLLKPWQRSLARAIETGAAFSASFPITPPERCNDIGQRYYGPVVLITNARCYSTIDIFAAGFKDHNIGPILGTDDNTGAGGANVWRMKTFNDLFQGTPNKSPLELLPEAADFSVSIRRTLRVGAEAGTELEDLGVTPDKIHDLTRDDVLSATPKDLLEAAAALIKERTQTNSRLSVANASRQQNDVKLDISSANLDRVDVLVNGRPRESRDIQGNAVQIAFQAAQPATVELRGYTQSKLGACRRLTI